MSDTAGWAMRLRQNATLACGSLRLYPGIEACADAAADVLWLRGRELTEELGRDLRKLALDGLFTVAADGAILREGCLLPIDRLPSTGWLPLDRWLMPAPQPTAPAAKLSATLAIRLERCDEELPPAALLTTIESWAGYAQTAPAVRLSVLIMAASQDGRVIIRGTPLPSIAGTRYAENSGIAVPCGWAIRPRVDATVLLNLLALREGDLALFDIDCSYERIPGNCFTRCTRAVTRQTLTERTA